MMIKPMLAVPTKDGDLRDWREWAIEEKFDGHRLVVEVDGPGDQHAVIAWGRPRKHAGSDGKTMAVKTLPPHLVLALSLLPKGTYDGELLGGDTSTDVTRTDLAHTLRFVMFDVMIYQGANLMGQTYTHRRQVLETIFAERARKYAGLAKGHAVTLATSHVVTSEADMDAFLKTIWARGGEGAILKRRAATYQAGKRSPDFIKLKKLFTAVCKVTGFEATRGKVLNRGIFAKVTLEVVKPAKEHPKTLGHHTSVKTLDDAELAAFQRAWDAMLQENDAWRTMNAAQLTALANKEHPAIGRLLRIEYQDIAADGGLRHPRWDRWEDE